MNSQIKTYDKKPDGFSPKIQVAANYVNLNGKLLFLKIGSHKREGGFWGVPAGKLELGERPVEAAKRELFEETGIQILSEEHFKSFGELYFSKPEFDYVYHLYKVNLNSTPVVHLSEEHCSYQWVAKQEAEELPLMDGAKEALDVYYRLCPS